MDLPSLRTIPFLHRNGLARLRERLCWHKNGLGRTDSMLAYGRRGWRGWPMASSAHPRAMLAREQRETGTAGQTV